MFIPLNVSPACVSVFTDVTLFCESLSCVQLTFNSSTVAQFS